MFLYAAPHTDAERMAWDIYFASIVAMALHPGNVRSDHMVTSCAYIADEMLNERRKRIPCPGS